MKQRTPQEIADFFSIVLSKGEDGWNTQPWLYDDDEPLPKDWEEAYSSKCNFLDTIIDFRLVKDSSLYEVDSYFIPNTDHNSYTLQSVADFFECYFVLYTVVWYLFPGKPIVRYKTNSVGWKHPHWHPTCNSVMCIIEDEIKPFRFKDNDRICIRPNNRPIYLPKK